jgi:oligopeptide transport system substrate-binding protein
VENDEDMMKTRLHSVVILISAALLIVPIRASTFARQSEPVTLYDAISKDSPLSPAIFDPNSGYNMMLRPLYLGLTNVDPVTGSVIPKLATGWEVSENGHVWTFTLRDDVPWVRWDPAAGEVTVLRTVTAHDVAYGIQRVCDPRIETMYVELIDRLIAGCNALAARPVSQVTDADYDLVQVRALDDTTLEIHLQYAAGYFLTLSGNPILSAVPREIIEEYGDDWTEPGILVTNGPFVLAEWRDGRNWTLASNPYLPADVRGPGNVERVVMTVLDSEEDVYQAYLTNQLDLAWVPFDHVQEALADPALAAQITYDYTPISTYYAFANDKAPFDNVHVRRAFSAAFDRERWCRDLYGDYSACTPMIHFTPSGVFGAPPIDEIGVGFDPDYAREQLALAGYPGCEGFPEILGLAWEDSAVVYTVLAAQLEDVLGCDPALIRAEEVQSDEMFDRIDPASPEEYRPNMWIGGWYADYPDANSFLGDFLHCEGANDLKRPCSEVDDLIDQAAAASDPLVRNDLYRDIEERFFGPAGEFPLIPIHTGISWQLAKPWLEGPSGSAASRADYDWYTVDQAAQLAARGE